MEVCAPEAETMQFLPRNSREFASETMGLKTTQIIKHFLKPGKAKESNIFGIPKIVSLKHVHATKPLSFQDSREGVIPGGYARAAI